MESKQTAIPLAPTSSRNEAAFEKDPLSALLGGRFIRLKELKDLTKLSRSSIYAFMRNGKLPSSVAIGPRAVAWRGEDIDEWMKSRQYKYLKPAQPSIDGGAQ